MIKYPCGFIILLITSIVNVWQVNFRLIYYYFRNDSKNIVNLFLESKNIIFNPNFPVKILSNMITKKSALRANFLQNMILLRFFSNIKLAVIKVCIEAFFFQQLLVGPLLHDFSFVHNQNAVRLAYCGKPMGDHKARTAFHHFVKGFLDVDLRSCVDGGGGFVEYQQTAR